MTSGETGSYRIGEARFRDAELELARLRAQAEVAWPEELRVLELHGLRDDADVLEAGCGPGFFTRRLLESVGRGLVTALDLDPAMLAHARELVGVSERVRFMEASAASTGLPGGSFDLAIARFLLRHLPDPQAAVRELRRVLRPGGRLIVVDSDVASALLFDPEPPFFAELMTAVTEAQRLLGGDSKMGRRIPRLLVEAGFSDVAVDAVVAHSVVVGRERIQEVIPLQVVDHMETAGMLSPDVVAAAREHFSRADPDYDGMLSYLVVSGSA